MSISLEISAQIDALINKGKNRHSDALQENLAHGMVNHIYQQYVMTGWLAYWPQSARPKATDNWENRNIMRIVIQSPYLTSNSITVEIVSLVIHLWVHEQFVTNFGNVVYVTVNQHKSKYSQWNTNNDVGGEFSSQMSPDFLPQDWMDVYVYGDTVDNDMHNVIRGPISFVVLLI